MSSVEIEKSHCRFCAENKTEHELYVLTRDEELNIRITKIIESLKIDFIDFSNTKLPKCVCRACYAFLETADDFVTKAKNCQPQLSGIYEREDIPEMTVEVKTESLDTEAQELSDESEDDLPIIRAVLANPDINELQILHRPIPEPDVFVLSWKSYKWNCLHCSMSFDTMNELRTHSKYEHKKCFGFECADCDQKLSTFSEFIEHVRNHRQELKEFCPYCNKKFDDVAQCMAHIPEHGISENTTCAYCGEIFPSTDLLENHKSIYKMLELPPTTEEPSPKKRRQEMKYTIQRGWMRYKWTCQDCFESFNGVVPLRAHVQNVHNKCFAFKCMDCHRPMRNFFKFVEHVYYHQPSFKEFCQFCNKHIKKERKLKAHIKEHLTSSQIPCYGCGQIFENNNLLKKHIADFDAPAPPKLLSAQDTTCDYCGKILSNMSRLRSHMLTHIPDRPRSFVCDICKKGFQSKENLRCHKKVHTAKRYVCEICDLGFALKTTLKQHQTTHADRKFECHHCGKKFTSKDRLRPHIKCHESKQFACGTCGKMFRYNYLLEAHKLQHTDTRPFACGLCDRTFTIRPLLNKHMNVVHHVSLAEYESAVSTEPKKTRQSGGKRK